eukprot:scaffold9.g3300.t1
MTSVALRQKVVTRRLRRSGGARAGTDGACPGSSGQEDASNTSAASSDSLWQEEAAAAPLAHAPPPPLGAAFAALAAAQRLQLRLQQREEEASSPAPPLWLAPGADGRLQLAQSTSAFDEDMDWDMFLDDSLDELDWEATHLMLAASRQADRAVLQ